MNNPSPLTAEQYKVIEPNMGRGVMCKLLGHLWDKPYTNAEMFQPAKLRLCVSCKRWVLHGNGSDECGSPPPHPRLLLSIANFIGDIINLFIRP